MPRIHGNSIADNLDFRNIQKRGVYNQGVEIPDATTITTITKTTITRNNYSFYSLVLIAMAIGEVKERH